ncbi:Oxysterol-binding C2F12.05c-like protein [Paramicrosporidium saccamoebae]|uniref:Oxysterol-binding C2F12.05c-like protein n=1 Tax=Paramicrosporidium saccamoebae TaxID=1246581 RepID=A0A2H9TLI4_9FUNG|nr:Oxysterol-binding C2F12.05c-like protein [Paramicrosporidium saccamoebae]
MADIHEKILLAVDEGVLSNVRRIVEKFGTTLAEYRTTDGSTVLHLSAFHGPTELTRSLLGAGVDANAPREDGSTALHVAAAAGRLSTVEVLLAAPNIDDTLRDSKDRTPIEVSKTRQIEAAFQYARSCFVASTTADLFSAVQKGDVERIRTCMMSERAKNLVDLGEADTSGETLLHRAVKSGKPEVVQACLSIGADPFAKNKKGKLPLEITQSVEIRQLLKEAPMVGSPEIPADNSARLSGYLMKYVNFASGYKRRFIVLEDGILSYFKSEADFPVRCKGSISVQFAKLVCPPGERVSFELRAAKYSLYFRAYTQAEASRWVMALGRWQRDLVEDDLTENQRALKVADTLHRRSQTSMVDPSEDFLETLEAAKKCLDQLVQSHPTNSGSSPMVQLGAAPDSVCQHMLQSLQEFFRLCSEREEYWQGRLNAEVRQRAMVEEALRRNLNKTKMTINDEYSARSGEYSARTGEYPTQTGDCSASAGEYSTKVSSPMMDEEFYDALDENLAITDEEISELEQEALSEESPVIPRATSAETFDEPNAPHRAVPAGDLLFIADDAEGYSEMRRDKIPVESNKIPPISIWNFIKNAIGKDLTRIPVPVNFSEPLSMLQRLCEDLEYADLLYMASTAEDPLMRLQYVAAFAVSPYSSTDGRVSKPFNPLLGETFEYISHEHGFRYISEQVSHHPPISACYCESQRYVYYAEVLVKTKFWKTLELVPDGLNHVYLKDTKEHFSYRKVTTAVYNLIMGKMWLDHYGPMRVVNHQTGHTVELDFKATGWRTSDPRRIEGTIMGTDGTPLYKLEGYWHRYLRSKNLKTGQVVELWRRRALPPWSPEMYNFTYFTTTLNELSSKLTSMLPPTDARRRPDQRAMEDGQFESANDIKVELEERQRARRKEQEAIPDFTYQPRWFRKEEDADSGEPYWKYLGGYWETRRTGQWEGLDVFKTVSEISSAPTSLMASQKSTPQLSCSDTQGSSSEYTESSLSSE